jgi:ribose/xylose/arabinose/galactoside ABC-type transport system permease subunit
LILRTNIERIVAEKVKSEEDVSLNTTEINKILKSTKSIIEEELQNLMDSVAVAFIGLFVLGAGKLNALGTFVGTVLIGILQNGFVMMSVPYYAMDIVKGSVLALALKTHSTQGA